MKEISEINKNLITGTTSTRYYRMSKRWKKVSNSTHGNNLKDFNDTKMLQYHFILAKVIANCLRPGDTYFSRDYKDDNVDAFSIHAFVSPCFLWIIDCNLNFEIEIYYEFYQCPFEHEVRDLFMQCNLHNYVRAITKLPDLPTHFKGVVNYQEPHFIHFL